MSDGTLRSQGKLQTPRSGAPGFLEARYGSLDVRTATNVAAAATKFKRPLSSSPKRPESRPEVLAPDPVVASVVDRVGPSQGSPERRPVSAGRSPPRDVIRFAPREEATAAESEDEPESERPYDGP